MGLPTALLCVIVLAPTLFAAADFNCGNFVTGKMCSSNTAHGNTNFALEGNSVTAAQCKAKCEAKSVAQTSLCCYYTPGGGAKGCKLFWKRQSSPTTSNSWDGSMRDSGRSVGRQAMVCYDVNTCTCSNGNPKTGSACTTNGAEMCASCNSGFRLSNGVCQPNICTCSNGNPKTGSACTTNGAEMCTSCDSGFYSHPSDGSCRSCDTSDTNCATCSDGTSS
jgi:hypothetical protein